jgi:hypothetical protein
MLFVFVKGWILGTRNVRRKGPGYFPGPSADSKYLGGSARRNGSKKATGSEDLVVANRLRCKQLLGKEPEVSEQTLYQASGFDRRYHVPPIVLQAFFRERASIPKAMGARGRPPVRLSRTCHCGVRASDHLGRLTLIIMCASGPRQAERHGFRCMTRPERLVMMLIKIRKIERAKDATVFGILADGCSRRVWPLAHTNSNGRTSEFHGSACLGA